MEGRDITLFDSMAQWCYRTQGFAVFLFDSLFPIFSVSFILRSIKEVTSRNDNISSLEAAFLRRQYTILPITLARCGFVPPEDVIENGNRLSMLLTIIFGWDGGWGVNNKIQNNSSLNFYRVNNMLNNI